MALGLNVFSVDILRKYANSIEGICTEYILMIYA